MSPKWISIKLKVALVIFLVSGLSFGLFFTINYKNTIQRIHHHTEQMIALRHQTHIRYIQNTLAVMQQDSETIMGFPPIPGIFRARQSPSNIDPLDGSSLAEWRQRLETLFTSLLQNRPAYSQIRLILAEDNWTEFARVNRNGAGASVVPEQELQAKGNEPYIKALKLSDARDIFFSNITRNRENGQIVGPPALRSLKRLTTPDGRTWGVIVVNASATDIFAPPNLANPIGQTFYEVKNRINPALGIDESELRYFVGSPGKDTGLAQRTLSELPSGKLTLVEDDTGVFVTYLNLLSAQTPFSIYIGTAVNTADLYQEAHLELRRNITNAIFLTIIASLLGYVFTARLLTPFQSLVQDITRSSETGTPLEAKFEGGDEISVISQGFAQLNNNLIQETLRLDMVLKNIDEGIITARTDGFIEDVNPATTRILDGERDALIGRNLQDILPCSVAEQRQIFKNTFGEVMETTSLEVEFETGENPKMLQINLTRAHYVDGNRIIVLIRDVTERALATQKSEALIAALQKSNAELDQFAYVASHDLKAPLRVINNAVAWLEEDLAPHLTEDTKESMELLRSRASRMERLLNDLLEHSRIGRIEEPEIGISGHEMADELRSLLEIPEGITVSFSEKFLELEVKKLPLQTILVNLISNGIKHHDRQNGAIIVDARDADQGNIFSVTDDGPGIQKIYHDRIFEIFQTLKSRDQLESSGMGLAFVKKHIDICGGRIRVISDGQRGSTFEFYWPDIPQCNSQAA
ncbi:ATP-binding protein [Phaeobacter sp. HF9A]|uniref:sensor histidine kinase n=1 Tax=Phaeobacter sp. HF9A TaxID=2721561 RepID=UPI00142F46A0|nr:ATP-binding protein [Phaeobacter sp. HF9A]NIZ13826.1 PAS domain-containing protein [Phaeobacter sp. HF9A]